MAKKKKNLILLLVLCVVLAGCLTVYFVMPQKEEGENDTEAAENITVDTIETADVSSLTVEKEGKEVYSVRKEGDTWQFSDQPAVPLDNDSISGLLGCLNPVKASREIRLEENRDLSQYGLDDPVMTVRVGTAEGKNYEYKLGSDVPVIGGYYGMPVSGDRVYCLTEELYTAFDIEKNSLIQIEELPEIETSYLTSLKVENKKGNDFEAVAGDDGKTWEVVKPDKKSLAEDDSQWDTVKGYFTSLAYDSIAEYQSDDLAKYGLKEPSSLITIKYYEEKEGVEVSGGTASGNAAGEIAEENRKYKTLCLCVGDSCEEGYYVCEKGSANVYVMAADMVENMTEVDI